MSVGPDCVSAQSNLMQFHSHDLPGWNGTTNNTRLRGYRAERTCSRAEMVQTLEKSNLVENAGPVLVFVEAGNVPADPAARGLVSGRDVDLILNNQTGQRSKADRQKQYLSKVRLYSQAPPPVFVL